MAPSSRYGRVLKVIAKFALDFAVAAGSLAFAVSILLGFDGLATAGVLGTMLGVALLKTGLLYAVGGQKRIWHYTGLHEMVFLGLTVLGVQTLLLVASVSGWVSLSPAVVLVDAAPYLLGIAALRTARRIQVMAKKHAGPGPEHVPRTLLLGAGDTANSLLGDLQSRNHRPWSVVGVLDDDPRKQGARIRGFRVLGSTTQLESLVRGLGIEHVVIAMPSVEKGILRNLINRSQACGVTVQAIPSLEDLLRRGRPAARRFPVTLEDVMDSAEVKRTLLPSVRSARDERTVLVTGGAGYIGSHLVEKLLTRGYRVRVLDNLMYGETGLNELQGHPNLDVRIGDISSIRDVVSSVKDVDSVVALAAIVGDPACGLNAEETLNLNYESTKILTEACNFYGVRRLVFASSCSVYGASDDHMLTEESSLNPVSLYARTRIMSEDVVFDRSADVDPVVLRLSTVFGYSKRMRFDLVVNLFTAKALLEGRIHVFGGKQWRPFVHCRDVAEAFALAIEAPAELVRRQIFNVGSTDANYTIAQVAALVARCVGESVEVNHDDTVDDLRNYRVSFAKIHDSLGFEPEYTLEKGIVELADAMQNDPTLRAFEDSHFSNLKFLRDRFESAGLGARAAAVAH